MKIVFATLYDTKDVSRGSGTYYFMSRELERQGHIVHYAGPIKWADAPATRIFRKLSHWAGKQYRSYQDPFASKRIGQLTSDYLKTVEYDVLITNDYGIAGYTSTQRPIILYTDAVFPIMYSSDAHPWSPNLSSISVKFCQHVNRRGLNRSDLCIFPTEWAIEEVQRYGYDALKSKTECVEFGANLSRPPSGDITQSRNLAKSMEEGSVDLLFVGKDWNRKGGDIAVATVQLLREQGYPVNLHIVGAVPDIPNQPDYIQIYGYIDKEQSEGRMRDLFTHCDVLMVPTKAEGFGIVFVEAAAYGMPSLSFATTGVTSAVKHGTSGILLDVGSTSEDFASIVRGWLENPTAYDILAQNARAYYDSTVNWRTAVERLVQIIEMRFGSDV